MVEALMTSLGLIADTASILSMERDFLVIATSGVFSFTACLMAIYALKLRTQVKAGVIAVIMLFVSAGILGWGVRSHYFSSTTKTTDAAASPSPSASVSASPPAIKATLFEPSPDNTNPLPMCTKIRFTAPDLPVNRVYVTAIRAVRESRFTFELTVKKGDGDTWMQEVQLGDATFGAGMDFEIVGYVVDKEYAEYLATTEAPELVGWYSPIPPKGSERLFQVTKKRDLQQRGFC